MVAIVSGNSLGLGHTSLATLGQHGQIGSASHGRNGQSAFVNVATGNLLLQNQDDYLVGRGNDAAVLRTYNSRGETAEGTDWITGAFRQPLQLTGTVNTAGSSIVRTASDGAAAVYKFNATRNAYLTTEGDGAYDTISFIAAAGAFEWTDGATGARERYEASGALRLLSSRDHAGQGLTYAYGSGGLPSTVTTANGEKTHYDYSGGRLAQVRTETASGATSTRVRYAYDTLQRLKTVVIDLSPEDNSTADSASYRTDYSYEDLSSRIARVTQTDGSTLALTYVQVGTDYRVATITDTLGQLTEFTYSLAAGQPGYTTVTDPLGRVTRYEVDAAGRLTEITEPAAASAARTRQFTYNANGDVSTVTDAEGRVTRFAYDLNGNRTEDRDPLGQVVKRTFGAGNQLLTETVHDGVRALTTFHVYDASHPLRLRFVVSPEGRVTEHQYNAFGQRISSATYMGGVYPMAGLTAAASPDESELDAWRAAQDLTRLQRIDLAYDARGQLQTRRTYATTGLGGQGIVDGTQSTERYVYDQAGSLLQRASARGGATSYTYDGLGRVRTVLDAEGDLTTTDYLDAANRTAVTTSGGLVTTQAYDRAGRLVWVLQSSAASSNLGVTRYYYDAAGQLRMTFDPAGTRNWMLYDAAGRKLADIDGNGTLTEYGYTSTDLLAYQVSYARAVDTARLQDINGLPLLTAGLVRPTASTADLRQWRTYDAAQRLVSEARSTGDGTQAAVTELRYDGASRLVQTVQYANLVSVGAMVPGAIPRPAASSQDRSSRSFHDADGRLVATLDAEGYLTTFTYDGAGLRVASTAYATATPSAWRATGTLAQLMPAASASDIRTLTLHDGKGQVIAEVDAEGYLSETVYDANGNVARTVRYANRVSAAATEDSTLASIRPASSPGDRASTRVYDTMDRLTQEIAPDGTVSRYEYDSEGRCTSTTRAAGTSEIRTILACYDLQGRLVGELGAEGAALLTGEQTQGEIDAIWVQHGLRHFYDAASRRRYTVDALGRRSFHYYNEDNALTHTVNHLGEVQESRYDALGRLSVQLAYAERISTTGLTGGIAPDSLLESIAAIANSSLDGRLAITYTASGAVASRSEAPGSVTSYAYNAFGDETASSQATGATDALVQAHTVDRRGLRIHSVADADGINAITRAVYDAFGRMTRSLDANGNARDQAYDRLGRVVTTEDPLNARRSSSYDAFGQVLTQTDARGHVTRYAYDKVARSMTVTTPEGITTTTVSNRHGEVQSSRDGKGQVTSYAYDRDGRLLKTTTPLTTSTSSYDRAGRVVLTTDAVGNQVKYGYDAIGRVASRTVDPDGLALVTRYDYDGRGQQVSVTDANGVVTVTAYDRKGQVLRQTVDPTGLNLLTSYAYDAREKLLSVRSPAGTLTQYTYDALGRRIQERVDPTGLDLVRSWAYDGNGNAVSSTDANGQVTRYAYDALDRLTYTVDPMGHVRRTGYDPMGRVELTAAYSLPIATAELGPAPTAATIHSLLVTAVGSDVVEYSVYDDDGRRVATVARSGAVALYTYDANGNVLSRTAYAKPIVFSSWVPRTLPVPVADSVHDSVDITVYDALDRAVYTMDGVGAVVAYSYDGNGNVLQRTAYADAIPLDTPRTAAGMAAAVAVVRNPARDVVTTHTYDAAGRLHWSVDGTGAVTRFIYDDNGNLVRRIAYVTPLALGAAATGVAAAAGDRIASMAYDAANRLVFEIDAGKAVTEQVFDRAGRVLRRTSYANVLAAVPAVGTASSLAAIRAALAPSSLDRSNRYGYDAAGRQVLAIDPVGAVTQRQFDAVGHVVLVTAHADVVTASLPTTLTADFMAGVLQLDAAADRTSKYAYDVAGRQAYAVDPLGTVTLTVYDGLDRLRTRTVYAQPIAASTLNTAAGIAAALRTGAADRTETYSYDAGGRLLQSTDALGHRELFTYDRLGRKTAFVNKSGAAWSYDHDAAGRVVRETAPAVPVLRTASNDAGPIAVGATYGAAVVTRLAYDALGNLVQRTEAAGLPEERVTCYEYDAVGRQVRVIFPQADVYSAAADALTSNGATGLASRAELTRLLETRTVYDALGNAVAGRDVGGVVSQKTYDAVGRIAYEVDGLGFVTRYQRNAFGEVTSLVRYGSGTTLARSVSVASQAVTTQEVQATLSATDFSHADDRTVLSTYDRAGRLVKVSEPSAYVYAHSLSAGAAAAVAAKTTTRVYDAFGQAVQVISNQGAGNRSSTSTQYFDKAGRHTATVDALGYLTRRAHDAFGNVVSETEYATALLPGQWTTAAFPAATASADDRTTGYSYDALNRLTRETRVNVEFSTSSNGISTRGNLSTSSTWDALGNQTAVTDAAGKTTYTYYDAMGRVRAVVAPTRPGPTDDLSPLTAFWRDAHGNVVTTIAYAKGAASFSASAYPTVVTDSANDRVTRSAYDSLGRLIQSQDALGASEYFSHDAYGKVAKTWRAVTDADGATRTAYQVNTYDKVGRLVRTVTPGSASVLVSGSISTVGAAAAGVVSLAMEYNGFGELTRKGTQGGRQEFFEHDGAGRLWRTNSGDGITRIQLFDVQGNVTAEIRSSGAGRDDADLLALADAEAAAARPYTRRTAIVYDDLGRVQARVEATRREVQGGVSVQRQFITATGMQSASMVDHGAEGGITWSGSNRVTLGWNSLSVLGSGDIKLMITYRTPLVPAPVDEFGFPTGPATGGTVRTARSEMIDGAYAAAGYTLTWPEDSTSRDGGIALVTRVVVYKKDQLGYWRVVIDDAPGYGAELIDLAASPNPDTAMTLQLRVAGSTGDTGWFAAGLRDYGNRFRYDASGLAPGSYEYRVQVKPPGEAWHVSADGVVDIGAAGGLEQSPDLNYESRWLQPTVLQKTDRWGNVVEITDPRSRYWKTTYTYNAGNQLVHQVQPTTGGAAGGPVTSLFYDKLGRQVAVTDARGFVTGQVWDAGGNLVEERQADTGVVHHTYNSFGNRTLTTDATARQVSFSYDRLGRMTGMVKGEALVYSVSSTNGSTASVKRPITETWKYDQLGQKISHRNGSGQELRYTYDLRGNLVQTTQPMGQAVRASYDAQGRKTAEQDANDFVATWTYDYHGALKAHKDLGGSSYLYTYDHARQLTAQTSGRGQNLAYVYDAAGQLTQIKDYATGKTTTYVYDLAGRRVREKVQHGSVFYQDNQLSYDARGQLRDVADGRVHITMEYDDAGNRTRIGTRVNYRGFTGEATHTSDRYFLYDPMNRQRVVDAVDATGAISKAQGHILTYDENGNRTSDRSWGNRVITSGGEPVIAWYNEDGSARYGTSPIVYQTAEGYVTEKYTYDALNRLQGVEREGVQIDLRRYDGADRVIQSGPLSLPTGYTTALNSGLAPGESNGQEIRINRYDANGRLLQQRIRESDGSLLTDISWDKDRILDSSRPDYVADGYDEAGNVLGYVVKNYASGNIEYVNQLTRFEGYQATKTTGKSTTAESGSTAQLYDVNGHLVGVTDATQGRNNRSFVNDAEGRVLTVKRYDGHVQRQVVANGEVLGSYGVGVNPVDPFVGTSTDPNFANIVDFDFGYSRVSASYPDATPGVYLVQSGDTLQAIAQASYGDSSLWYRLADANGLASSSDLKVGQALNIPNRVGTISNNSTTFKPYDPARMVGDTTPNLPMPKEGCGGVGKVLMVIVAVVVTIYTAGALSGMAGGLAQTMTAGTGVLTGATTGVGGLASLSAWASTLGTAGTVGVAAAAGSVASQVVGMATGDVKDFSWKSVALSAVGGAVSAGIQGWGPLGGGSTSVGNVMARAAVGNLVSQGAGVLTGLQRSFDWRGVAASAVGAGVGQAVAQGLGMGTPAFQGAGFGEQFGPRLMTALLAGTATAVARGGKVAVQGVATDAFGNAVGNSLAEVAGPQAREFGPNSDTDYVNGRYAGSDALDAPGGTWAADTAARKHSADPLGLRAYANDMSGVMRAAQSLWGAEPAGVNLRTLSDTSTNAELLENQMNEAGYGDGLMPTGGNVRVTPGMVNGISVNQRVNNAFQSAGDLAGIGDMYRDYRLLGGLMGEVQQQATIDRLKGMLQGKLGMMHVLPTPETLGAVPSMSSAGISRFNNVDLIERYSDAVRKMELMRQGVIELDTRTMLIISVGTGKLSPAEWVAENTRRYANAFTVGVDEGQRRYEAGKLYFPLDMPGQLQVGLFADDAARGAVIRYNRSIGVPEGPGQLLSMNRWSYEPSGSGAYNRIDLLMDLGPARNNGALILRTAIEGKASLAAVQSSAGQLQRVYEWVTPHVRTVTPQGMLPWTPQSRRLK